MTNMKLYNINIILTCMFVDRRTTNQTDERMNWTVALSVSIRICWVGEHPICLVSKIEETFSTK